MQKITNKEYEEYKKLKGDKMAGRILTLDGLRFICEASDFDAEKIGKTMLETYAEKSNETTAVEVKKQEKLKDVLARFKNKETWCDICTSWGRTYGTIADVESSLKDSADGSISLMEKVVISWHVSEENTLTIDM